VTNNDKTGDKLVTSIRRTKAGVTKKTVATKKAAVSKKKVSASTAERPQRRNGLRAGKPPRAQTDVNADPYQARRRVWPD
jgi:hypothetical protein